MKLLLKDGDKFTFDCPCCGEVHEGVGGQTAEIQCDPRDITRKAHSILIPEGLMKIAEKIKRIGK